MTQISNDTCDTQHGACVGSCDCVITRHMSIPIISLSPVLYDPNLTWHLLCVIWSCNDHLSCDCHITIMWQCLNRSHVYHMSIDDHSPPAIDTKCHNDTCLCHMFITCQYPPLIIITCNLVTQVSHDTYLCHMFITWQSHVIVHHWWSSPASLTWPLLVSHVYHIWNHMSLSTTDDHHLQVSHDTSLCHMSITWQSCVNILSCALIVLWKALPVEDSLDICYSVVSNSTRSSAMRQKYHN